MEGPTFRKRPPVEQNLYRQLKRYAAMTVANCAAAADNVDHIAGTHRDDAPYLKAMLYTLSTTSDPVLMSHIIRCFHNLINNSPGRCGRILIDAGLLSTVFLNPTNVSRETLRRSGLVSEEGSGGGNEKLNKYLGYDKIPVDDDSQEEHMDKLLKEEIDGGRPGAAASSAPLLLLQVINIDSCIYLCDMLVAMITSGEYCKVRIMKTKKDNPLIFQKILTHWEGSQLKDRRLAPHLALLCSTVAFEVDCQHEFLLQGGVRLVVRMYEEHFPDDEYVRLCCVLSILYLVSPADNTTGQEKPATSRVQE
ncbi:hypothetical protein FOZ63_006935, partial [Perkinsus olseni]